MEPIVNCNTSTKTVFSPHSHKQYEILLFFSGHGTFVLADKEYPFSAGTIVVVPPGAVHSSVSQTAVERLVLQGDFESVLTAREAVFNDTPNGEGAQLARLLLWHRFENQAYFGALCHAFLQFLATHLRVESALSAAVRHIAEQIGNSFADSQCRVADFLEQSGYAEDYIRAHFKKLTGKTPQAFLTQTRIQHACFLIETYRSTLPLAQVAEQCGYTDYVHFSKKFKAMTGVSPRVFLKR